MLRVAVVVPRVNVAPSARDAFDGRQESLDAFVDATAEGRRLLALEHFARKASAASFLLAIVEVVVGLGDGAAKVGTRQRAALFVGVPPILDAAGWRSSRAREAHLRRSTSTGR
jgi:hypothetical protein